MRLHEMRRGDWRRRQRRLGLRYVCDKDNWQSHAQCRLRFVQAVWRCAESASRRVFFVGGAVPPQRDCTGRATEGQQSRRRRRWWEAGAARIPDTGRRRRWRLQTRAATTGDGGEGAVWCGEGARSGGTRVFTTVSGGLGGQLQPPAGRMGGQGTAMQQRGRVRLAAAGRGRSVAQAGGQHTSPAGDSSETRVERGRTGRTETQLIRGERPRPALGGGMRCLAWRARRQARGERRWRRASWLS
ncbi:hypothetical protein K505DRAFT_160926 [Melanomma pulvis-pyrius CBS 109.77]|uniref:Uncharacterized protein n=1 Tax=Melanomma pulvis-pyrius CBS 109.77 TaxID=1314802 RepID=A0A6A6XKZ5_9PLEO|nr:hypothetical protein K505DRAFT_160926 [Melanomma pulvis-pyrius CBS 109.77]